MSARLLDRIKILARADAHGVVESLEERSLLLKQYVREAELGLGRERARLEALIGESRRLRDEIDTAREELRRLDDDVALALEGGEDELARFAIRRLLPIRAGLNTLETRIAQREQERRELEERVALHEQQLEGLRGRVRGELLRLSRAEETPVWLAGSSVADEEVELELMRRRQTASGTSI